MNEIVKMAWAIFLASLTFGIWTFPILIAMFVILLVVRVKWPDKFEKYF